jgi:hypothetical protein
MAAIVGAADQDVRILLVSAPKLSCRKSSPVVKGPAE